MKDYDVIVIGGGASGMMAAGRAAQLGAKVLLIEKNKRLGEKLRISGGGRCNITNAEFDVRKFLEHFPKAKQYLYSPFSKFSSKDAFYFFDELGLPLTTEARKRAFPKTQKASDVVIALQKYMKKGKVKIITGTPIQRLLKKDDKIIGVKTKDGQDYHASYYVLATGGASAPETGSTGDGWRMLKRLGHSVTEPSPNIVPLTTNETWVHELAGTKLSFMRITFKLDGKAKIKKVGKLLFTHFGISGPLILNSAYEVSQLLDNGVVSAHIDMFPDTDEKDLDKRLTKLFDANKNKQVKNVLQDMLQRKLATVLLERCNIDGDKQVNEVTKAERRKLMHMLKDLNFSIDGTLGFDRAVIADGGVNLKEVDFRNMTSRLYSNLYLLGDILNINRPSGGYSLQLAWTTGYVAGSNIGEQREL